MRPPCLVVVIEWGYYIIGGSGWLICPPLTPPVKQAELEGGK